MPKQIYKIDQFHGGLNTSSDPRDIADNELSAATDIMVDDLGLIRMMGGTAAHASENSASGHACAISAGYGLYAWNHDRVDGHTSSSNTDDAETGENYLALSDADSTGKVHIYASSDDTWGTPIDTGTNGTRKDVFYAVDGALRICDSVFTNTNSSRWYGYIDKQFMYNSGSSIPVDQWIDKSQYISRPGANSGWDDAVASSATTSTGHTHTSTSTGIGSDLTGTGTQEYFQAENVFNDGAGDAVSNIYTMDVTVRVQYDDVSDTVWSYTLTAGKASNSTTFVASPSSKSISYAGEGSVEDTNVIEDRVHTFTFAIGDTALSTGSTVGVRASLAVDILGGDVDSIGIHQVVVTEGASSGGSHDGVDGNDIDTNEVFVEAAFESTTNAIGWDRKWEHGFSFIYDGNQESLIRRIEKVDPSSGATSPPTYVQDNTANASHAPTVKISIPYASDWSPRITGGVWYIRDVSGTVPSEWWGQIECNFVQGTGKILSSGAEFDCSFNPTTSEYNFDVDHENLLQPNQTDTYFSRTGVLEDTESITSRFGSAVIVGRRVYIGNVQIIKDDGTKEVKGDAMLKSPPNRFDTFPSSNVVEAAVNDGESIIALEEFADRILQFKEQTLYIINVSQDIEFLEDVHKFKGVNSPASVCKTDYGIAWANKHGCYLYDGRTVINLLEKGGRKIIKDAGASITGAWENFNFTSGNAHTPQIGYLPKKRQLLVVDDNTTTGTGKIFIYDMVTQSWVIGGDASITSNVLTNFVNDSKGELLWAHTSGTATLNQWDDDSDSTTGLNITTKDIDFGQPGQRKKVYKVYLTFRGNATHAQVHYGVDGLAPALTFNSITSGTDGSSSGSGTAAKCIAHDAGTNDWLKAELKPSSAINNISSFRLKISGDGSNAVSSDFEINDISIVYRLKPVK